MKEIVHVQPEVLALLERNGGIGFDRLQNADIGKVISSESDGTEVRRWVLVNDTGTEEVFYLKRRRREPASRLLGPCLRLRRPHSGPWREMQLVMALRAAGFPAMEPVAWGERRQGFLPVAGFMLVRSVPGRVADEVFSQGDAALRSRFLSQMGALVGGLHRRGFFHPVRLKDLIATGSAAGELTLTLIDRETSKPWSSAFSPRFASASLARAARRTLREGHRLSTAEAIAFLRTYTDQLGACWTGSRRGRVSAIMHNLRSELKTWKNRGHCPARWTACFFATRASASPARR